MQYAISKEIPLPFTEAIRKVTGLLQLEGFGILTTIDMRDTLKMKLDVDIEEYVILGACNPPLAYEALQSEREIGLLLPCNIVVYRKENRTHVAAFDPASMATLSDNPQISSLAERVRTKLQNIMNSM